MKEALWGGKAVRGARRGSGSHRGKEVAQKEEGSGKGERAVWMVEVRSASQP